MTGATIVVPVIKMLVMVRKRQCRYSPNAFTKTWCVITPYRGVFPAPSMLAHNIKEGKGLKGGIEDWKDSTMAGIKEFMGSNPGDVEKTALGLFPEAAKTGETGKVLNALFPSIPAKE